MVSIENLDFRKASIALLGLLFLAGVLIQAGSEERGQSGFNRNDVMFMNMMIIHHDQAIDMAELAENRTDNENILELAKNISQAQTQENRQMTEWLNQLGYERPVRGHRMAGMASREEMEKLRDINGTEFNELFAALMIEHHEGGIAMSQNFYRSGENTELRKMQLQMIEAQQKEIRRMREWQEEDQL
ncbi:DUF305 domain-containing protein [Candidatus Nanosalina sp. VS9-1]|uniref:DUF305 domain-containing protein n=1 Tax=Candidatus Nanosalina sp. VS9-1 TaxID=3388566 RepID=UPI0039E11C6A